MEKQEVHKIIAENIRAAMNKKGFSNPGLAKKCDVSSGMISKIVNGQTGITITMAMTLAAGLEIDLTDILKGLTHAVTMPLLPQSPSLGELKIGILSLNNKCICRIRNANNDFVGQAEISGALDMGESSASLVALIKEAISEAWQGAMPNADLLKQEASLYLIVQGYEFEDARHKFTLFAEKFFHKVSVISDWQFTYLSDFNDGTGISLVIDKGVCLSYKQNDRIKKLGGWRFPVYDFGGEYWLGLETVQHTISAAEGYVPMSPLAQTILTKFNGKLERITELCIKSNKDADIYCLFCEYLLRHFHMGDHAAKAIVDKGFRYLNQMIEAANTHSDKPLMIALNGSLVHLYRPLFDESKLLPLSAEQTKLDFVVDIMEKTIY